MVKQKRFIYSGKPSLFALSPFFVFIGMYVALISLYSSVDNKIKLTAFPVFAAILAIAFSLFTFQEKASISKKIKIFISGAARPTVIYMCFIFIFSSIFSHVSLLCGGVDSAIKFCNILIPEQWILPGLFSAIALFSLTIGSSIGGIATFTPIAVGMASKLGVDPAVMAGIAVSGSMLGDNLSVISDTTIAAIHTTGCDAYEKFKGNALLVLPAFVITIIILSFIGFHVHVPLNASAGLMWNFSDIVKVIPYLAVFVLALIGIDVLAVLATGAFTAGLFGIIYGKFTFLSGVTYFFEGFYQQKGIVAIFLLVLLVAGLSRVVEHNGGIKYLLMKFRAKTSTKAGAERSIALLVTLLECAVARNTISILIAGPMAQQIGGKFKVKNARIATLLDIFACTIHGILPYSSQLLLAAAMAGTSSFAVMPHLYYLYVILAIAVLSIVKTKILEMRELKKNKKEDLTNNE